MYEYVCIYNMLYKHINKEKEAIQQMMYKKHMHMKCKYTSNMGKLIVNLIMLSWSCQLSIYVNA